MEQKSTTEKMTTLLSCLEMARQEGYTEDLKVTGKGLCTTDEAKCYRAEDVKVHNFYRFEGSSDPADNGILYSIETNDGLKGTLSDAYGTYADPKVGAFMKQVEEIEKQNPHPRH